MLRNSAFLIACPFFIASGVLTGFPRCGYDKHRLLHPFMRHRLCSLSVFQASSPAISGTETYQRAEAHSVLTHPNFTRLSAIKGGKQQKKTVNLQSILHLCIMKTAEHFMLHHDNRQPHFFMVHPAVKEKYHPDYHDIRSQNRISEHF